MIISRYVTDDAVCVWFTTTDASRALTCQVISLRVSVVTKARRRSVEASIAFVSRLIDAVWMLNSIQ